MSKAQLSIPGLPNEERRALAAWFRTGGIEQPKQPETWRCGGLFYVVLRNARGILAIYRVRNDGALKRLKRIPAELASSLG